MQMKSGSDIRVKGRKERHSKLVLGYNITTRTKALSLANATASKLLKKNKMQQSAVCSVLEPCAQTSTWYYPKTHPSQI